MMDLEDLEIERQFLILDLTQATEWDHRRAIMGDIAKLDDQVALLLVDRL